MNKFTILNLAAIIFLACIVFGFQTESPADPVAPDNNTAVYLVRQGDCLSKIAKMHGTTVTELVRLNRLPDQNMLSIGQPILINAAGGPAPATGQKSGKAPGVEIFIEKEPADPDYLEIKELNKKLNKNIQTAQYRQALEMTEQILASVTKFKAKLTEVVEVLP